MSAWYDQLYIPDPSVIKVTETVIAATEPCPDWAQECRECDWATRTPGKPDWDSSLTPCQNLGATAGDVGGGCMPTNWLDYYHYGMVGGSPCNPDGTRDLHHVLIRICSGSSKADGPPTAFSAA